MKFIFSTRQFASVAAAALVATAVASSPAVADWMVNAGESSTALKPQDIVISLKLNPRSNPEAACLAVTLARSLRGDFSPPGAPPTNANVTLFPTLDGVAIGDAHVVSRPRFRCTTPEQPVAVISLEENLEDFLCDSGDRDDCLEGMNMSNMVVCPICWTERYGEDAMPEYGVLNPQAVGAVLLNAEKVFDF